MSMRTHWITRAEEPGTGDASAIRAIDLAAFDTPLEADLVEALRTDAAWIDGLSVVASTPDDTVAGHALLTRCHIGDTPALCLGPVAVLPEYQRTGAGSAAVRTALKAAGDAGERFVTVLGHPAYYPRFGFTRAAAFGELFAPRPAPPHHTTPLRTTARCDQPRRQPHTRPAPQPTPLISPHGLSNASPADGMHSRVPEFRNRLCPGTGSIRRSGPARWSHFSPTKAGPPGTGWSQN